MFRTYIWTVGDNECSKDCLYLPTLQSEARMMFAFLKKVWSVLRASDRFFFILVSPSDIWCPHPPFNITNSYLFLCCLEPEMLKSLASLFGVVRFPLVEHSRVALGYDTFLTQWVVFCTRLLLQWESFVQSKGQESGKMGQLHVCGVMTVCETGTTCQKFTA